MAGATTAPCGTSACWPSCSSPRPPELLALNEPETSIHADLLEPLARLIVKASESSQILIVTHSRALAAHIEAASSCPVFRLEKVDSETVVAGRSLAGDDGGV